MDLPKDSGATREFETGAHRDASTGKGRCDLLPLYEVATIMDDPVLESLAKFMKDKDKKYIEEAVRLSKDTIPQYKSSLPNMMLEVSMLYEAGAIKYGQNNWRATRF